MQKMSLRVITLIAGSLWVAGLAFGDPISFSYVNWTSSTPSTTTTAGSATGTLNATGTPVTVTYSGSLLAGSTIDGLYAYPGVYTNSTVANAPANNQVLELTENPPFTQTITFSSAVVNPILDIVSLGNGPYNVSVTYNFSQTPTLLSQGSAAYGTCTAPPCMTVSGNSVTGTEADGVLEFVGTYTSITFTTTGAENWNGFTVGAQTPEPASWATMGLGALGVVAGLWRRRRTA